MIGLFLPLHKGRPPSLARSIVRSRFLSVSHSKLVSAIAMEIGFSLERGRGDPSWYGGSGGRRRMLEQASERGLLSGSGALLRGRRLGRSATDRQRAPRMAFLRGPSRPPISAPFPQMDSSLCLFLTLWACRITLLVLRAGCLASTRAREQEAATLAPLACLPTSVALGALLLSHFHSNSRTRRPQE